MWAILSVSVLSFSLAQSPAAAAVVADDVAAPAADAVPTPEPAQPAEAAAQPAEPVPPPEPTEPTEPPRPAVPRIVVKEIETTDLPSRLAPIFTASLVSELRKLHGVRVIGMDEVRDLIEAEADRQTVGCSDDGCAVELAEALGANIVVIARLARIGEEHIVSIRRLDVATAKTGTFDRRFEAGNGEEFLSAIGAAVAELFSDRPLRPGATRGVDREVGRTLNPPPVSPWVFSATAATAALLLGTGAGAGLISTLLASQVQERVDESVVQPANGADLKGAFTSAQRAALVANVSLASGAVVAGAALVMALFTDFWGYGNAE